MRSATDTTVLIEQDCVENRVSIDRVTKMPRGPGDTVTPATPTEPDAQAATPRVEYVVDRIVGHRMTRGGIEYKVAGMGTPPPMTLMSPPRGSRNRLSTDFGVRAKDGQVRARSAPPGHVRPHRQDEPARKRRESPPASADDKDNDHRESVLFNVGEAPNGLCEKRRPGGLA